ncbi:MAG: hypothetical protein EBW14_06970, partial [Oxalobacteraceae bacterium]|nr:hypothetical protein [Oxalobacteraceae bacterium]
MFIDSHCHLDFPELSERLPEILQKMQDNQVSHALCVSVTLPEFPNVLALAEAHPNLYASAPVPSANQAQSMRAAQQGLNTGFQGGRAQQQLINPF